MNDDDVPGDERAERRDARRESERSRMPRHGASSGWAYRDAVLKRLRKAAGLVRKRKSRRN